MERDLENELVEYEVVMPSLQLTQQVAPIGISTVTQEQFLPNIYQYI